MSVETKSAADELHEIAEHIERARGHPDVGDLLDSKLADYAHDVRRLAIAVDENDADAVAGSDRSFDELRVVGGRSS